MNNKDNQAAPVQQPGDVREDMPTDISMRLRNIANTTAHSALILSAADEIERYYGGMLAWKQTAEKKDADWNAERMARVDDRVKARNEALAITRPSAALTASPEDFESWAARQDPPYQLHRRPESQQRGAMNIYSNQRTQHAYEGYSGARLAASGGAPLPAEQPSNPVPLTDSDIKECFDGIDFSRMVTADDIFYMVARAIEARVVGKQTKGGGK